MAKSPRFGFAAWVDELRPAAVEIDAVNVTPEACRDFHRTGSRSRRRCSARTIGPRSGTAWSRRASTGSRPTAPRRSWRGWPSRQRAAGGRRSRIIAGPGGTRRIPLPALKKSVRLGADFVEFDVRTARDGAFILLHDGTLNRTTDGRGPVRDRSGAGSAPRCRGLVRTDVPGDESPRSRRVPRCGGATGRAVRQRQGHRARALAEVLAKHGLVERAIVYQHVEYLKSSAHRPANPTHAAARATRRDWMRSSIGSSLMPSTPSGRSSPRT